MTSQMISPLRPTENSVRFAREIDYLQLTILSLSFPETSYVKEGQLNPLRLSQQSGRRL